jgi:hypothetical protein
VEPTDRRKMVFILVSRGFGVRNILRSGVLKELEARGVCAVLVFHDARGKPFPTYLRKEFEDKNVVIEVVRARYKGKVHRKFWNLSARLVYNKTNRLIRYEKYGRPKFLLELESFLFMPLSGLPFLKRAARYLEKNLFRDYSYAELFEKYKPDAVFSTSIISSFDSAIMKEAQHRDIKTVSMPRGWDNVTTLFYRVEPDVLIVQNEIMKRGAEKRQSIRSNKIRVTGFPQFDWYRKEGIVKSREKFCASVGLDPRRKIIFWGSSGVWTPNDNTICETLTDIVENDKLDVPASLFIRSHFTDAVRKRFDYLKERKNVHVDENFTFSDFFWDNFDAPAEEIIQFINTMYHADVVISLCSTLVLDALFVDKPVINTAFEGLFDKKGNDISPILYRHDHYQPLLSLGVIDLVYTREALIDRVNENLMHPEKRKKERKQALKLLCYKDDGLSSQRIADVIFSQV